MMSFADAAHLVSRPMVQEEAGLSGQDSYNALMPCTSLCRELW